ncbi:hypothetical protein [Streptomyces capillispiralis]|uniref:Lipoprotein n=1 Tax=Streptomyces capillispiralis TaxID=68182 RepID=A0A561TFQ9_9ACTN|nr:hypothetical protein [Streptomyces capillispiralis]TWF85933.1 hypothetical protein FHX78_112891 [Streptomyces capillispiralis]
MKRRSLPVAVALTTTAALLLTACGGEDANSKGDDAIAGADTSGSETTASPTADTSGTAQRPKITLPGDVKNVFEQWKTGDPAKDALLEDVTQRINATDAAIVAADPESEALPFYYKDEALAEAAQWVQRYVDDGKSITGTVRFYNPDLVMVDKDTAALAYCADETKAADKDRKTGKADEIAVNNDSYVAYNTRVQKDQNGIWQTTSLLSERGNAKCVA